MLQAFASIGRRFFGLFAGLLVISAAPAVFAGTDQTIYTDLLQNGWQDWGWATLNYNNTSPVHSGSKSIAVTITDNSSQAIYIAHPAFDSGPYTNITFWINGGASGGQRLLIQGHAGNTYQASTNLPPLPTNAWVQMSFSLADMGVANRNDMDGFWIQDRTGAPQATFYLDDITLVGLPPTPALTNIYVDASLNRHAISPLIYGVAFASSNQLSDLNATLNRSGGNAQTRYNWQLNAKNHAADWYFESLKESTNTPGADADDLVANSKSAGAEPMMTIPMIGWMPKLGPNRALLPSYSIAKYGPQTGHDPYYADAGNGVVASNGALITTNNPNDANFLTNSDFQKAWVQHLTNRWGFSTNGGVRYYCMDNEHTIWHSTHRDIHPVGTTMQEIRDRFFDYAGMVKSVDPAALVLAPEEWGWGGYLYSGYDQQWSALHTNYDPANYPDRATNGGWDYGPWLLDQFRQRATNTNQRLLDYFTFHIYPQGANEFGDDVSTGTQLGRNRSTRALWDTNYVDASWISSIIKLIPRMKGWVATYYPGTKIGITEYNWGAQDHINGATAQADILGIFGREGLDLATRWETPGSSTPTYNAMKMYRNYDGNKSTFGDISLSASGLNPDNTSTFAAIRSSDGALTLMVINKQLSAPATNTIYLTNFLPSGVAQRWQLTSANVIAHLSDLNFTGNSFTNTVPAQSITLYVLSAGNAAHLRAGTISSSNTFDFWLDAQASQRYIIQSSSNLVNWTPVQTNTLASNSCHVVAGASGPKRFYRAQWSP
jgi:hypothetical protein